MKITEFIETAGNGKYHVIESIIMIFFEFEIERWHDKGYIFNCNMDGDNFLAIYSNHRNEMLSQFYFDVLIIGYTQIDVLDCVDLGSHK